MWEFGITGRRADTASTERQVFSLSVSLFFSLSLSPSLSEETFRRARSTKKPLCISIEGLALKIISSPEEPLYIEELLHENFPSPKEAFYVEELGVYPSPLDALDRLLTDGRF